MNTTKTKGDILAERIEDEINSYHIGDVTIRERMRAMLADYLAPRTLGRTVNGHTLGDGQEWHRQDFTEDMLPDGWRPLLLNERDQPRDEYCGDKYDGFCELGDLAGTNAKETFTRRRTLRPLPSVDKPILTPETDAIRFSSNPREYYELANRLERERDELRAEVERLKAACEKEFASVEHLDLECSQLKEEREQWRMSSVCRELRAEVARLTAELDGKPKDI